WSCPNTPTHDAGTQSTPTHAATAERTRSDTYGRCTPPRTPHDQQAHQPRYEVLSSPAAVGGSRKANHRTTRSIHRTGPQPVTVTTHRPEPTHPPSPPPHASSGWGEAPLAPRTYYPTRDVLLTRHQQEFPDSRPIPAFPLTCDRHGWIDGPWAFPRASHPTDQEPATHVTVGTGRTQTRSYVFDIRRTSSTSSLTTCDLVSHATPR